MGVRTRLPARCDAVPTTADRRRVYTFHVDRLRGFGPLWKYVAASSVVPPGFDADEFARHIAQPHLQALAASLDVPPTDEMIRIENDPPLMELRDRSFPDPRVPYLSGKDGLVNLKTFMTDDSDFRFLSSHTARIFGQPVTPRGHFLYPPGGFLQWHTNVQHAEGWRMYVIDVDREEESFFRFVDPVTGELVTRWDRKGIVHLFYVGRERPCWHCVKSVSAHRWSRGFLIPDDWNRHLVVTDAVEAPAE
jgi:hypothetical protein